MTAVRLMPALVLAVCLGLDAAAAPLQKKAVKASRARAEATTKSRKKAAKAPAFPSYDDRHGAFLRLVSEANANGYQPPDPLSQYLVDELVVTGLFETEDGYGAFFLARPSGNTFFAAPGVSLYNGRFLEIRLGRPGYLEDVRVVFSERAGAKGAERTVVKTVEGIEPKAPPPAPAPPAPAPAEKSGAKPAEKKPADAPAEPAEEPPGETGGPNP